MAQKRRQYSRELKEEAVAALVSPSDVTIKKVPHNSGIHRSVLERWCRPVNTASKACRIAKR